MKHYVNTTRRNLLAAGTLALGPLVQSQAASAGNKASNIQITSLPTMAALRNSKMTAGSGVMLAGYHAPNDGGGGLFVLDVDDRDTPDNGGTVIAAEGGGRWKRIELDGLTVRSFGAKGDGLSDDGPAITAAHAFATSRQAELVFPGGTYVIGAGISFVLDPMKVRWRSAGPARLRWAEVPRRGYALQIVASASAAYATAGDMTAKVMDGIQILGGSSSKSRYPAVGLKIGNGSNHTAGLELDGIVVQGFTTLIEFTNNVWWITLRKPRLLWGTIDTPSSPQNFGENITWYDAELLDGVIYTINGGDTRLFAGSCDNSSVVVKGTSQVAWHGAHFENPGAFDLAHPFIDVQGAQASVQLTAAVLVINAGAKPIRQSPFAVAAENQVNGLLIDGLQYTQGGHVGWFTLVSGKGKVSVRNPQILAFANQHYQVFAENAHGKLNNAGFENGNLDGWDIDVRGAATVACSKVRKHSGSQSCLLRTSGSGFAAATLKQKITVCAGAMVMMKLAYSRAYEGNAGVLTGQLVWLDGSGNALATSKLPYAKAPAGTDDGAEWLDFAFNGLAPGGTMAAELQIQFQRTAGEGSPGIYIDDVTVNVV